MLDAVLQLPESRLILNMLCAQLPGYVHYHTVHHTLDVCSRAEELALQEGMPAAEQQLLLIAAIYHDAAHLQAAENHETLSCWMAVGLLPTYGYSGAALETICTIIMATQIPQKTATLLEQILCDADLDYLGRDDFYSISQLLFQEFQCREVVKNAANRNNLQVAFLENHHYFTATAIKQLQATKNRNLHRLKQKPVQL